MNEQIRAPEVRVVKEGEGQEENENYGVFPIEDARKMAEDKELDLVEISPKATPRSVRSSTTTSSFTTRKRNKRSSNRNKGKAS